MDQFYTWNNIQILTEMNVFKDSFVLLNTFKFGENDLYGILAVSRFLFFIMFLTIYIFIYYVFLFVIELV